MNALVSGLLLGIVGLVAAAAVGRYLSTRWAPGILGGITGGFGVGTLRISGYGGLDLLSLAGVMVVYGVLVGLAALAAREG